MLKNHFHFIIIISTRRLIMLVLSRREQERIRLGDSIVVTIIRVSGERVRIGNRSPARGGSRPR